VIPRRGKYSASEYGRGSTLGQPLQGKEIFPKLIAELPATVSLANTANNTASLASGEIPTSAMLSNWLAGRCRASAASIVRATATH
jgi:hypothetical protein